MNALNEKWNWPSIEYSCSWVCFIMGTCIILKFGMDRLLHWFKKESHSISKLIFTIGTVIKFSMFAFYSVMNGTVCRAFS